MANTPASSHDSSNENTALADVVKAWPDLPATIKAGILAMVKATKG